MSTTEQSIAMLLDGLKRMVFYDNRFAAPVSGLNPEVSQAYAAYNYIAPLVGQIPEEFRDLAVAATLQRLVANYGHCPSPKEVRRALAEGTLKVVCDSDMNRLFEDAKRFLAFPPNEPQAQNWKNQVIYGAIKALGRPRFAEVDLDGWGEVVVDVIFGDRAMVAYREMPREEVKAVSRPFSSLLPK